MIGNVANKFGIRSDETYLAIESYIGSHTDNDYPILELVYFDRKWQSKDISTDELRNSEIE